MAPVVTTSSTRSTRSGPPARASIEPAGPARRAAGHPDLVFELEAFSAAMPRHWKETADADAYKPVRTFAVGQLVHLRASLDRLARRVKGPVWPEYAELDCFACHHSLTRAEDSWRQAQGYENRARPGLPPAAGVALPHGAPRPAAWDAPAAHRARRRDGQAADRSAAA